MKVTLEDGTVSIPMSLKNSDRVLYLKNINPADLKKSDRVVIDPTVYSNGIARITDSFDLDGFLDTKVTVAILK